MPFDPKNNPLKYLLIFVTALSLFRICYAAYAGLAPDEAYYWTWSTNLSLHYPDHPPMIAWLIALGTSIIGETALGVRISSILIGALSTLLVYALSREIELKKTSAAMAGILSTLLPATSTAAILATPDSFLGICWLLAAILLVRLSKNAVPTTWYLLGAVTGVAMYAKHSALLIPVAALATIFFCKQTRNSLRTAAPYLAIILAVLIALPYLYTEAATGFSSLAFQGSHLGGGLRGNHVSILSTPLRWIEVLGGQAGLLAVVTAFWSAKFIFEKNSSQTHRSLSIMIITPIAATMVAAIFTHPEQNWAALGSPIAAIAAIKAISTRASFTRHFVVAVLTAVLFSSIIHAHTMNPFLPLPPKKDPVLRLHGWEQLPDKLPKNQTTIICDNYGLASQIKWQTRHQVNRPSVFSTDRPTSIPSNINALLLDQENDFGNHPLGIECKSTSYLKTIILTRPNKTTIRSIMVFKGKNCTFKRNHQYAILTEQL